MKKFLSLILSLVLMLACTMSVSADVIFEPDDDFYEKYRSECTLTERYFIAAEEVYTVNEPGSEVVYGKVNEGDRVYISYTYEDSDGIVWGLISFTENISGWLPMGYLEVIYDNISFTQEFGSEFNTETDDLKLPETEKLIFWKYPGSESYAEMELWDESYMDMGFIHSYTDANGTVWGYVGYFYGMDGWLRIDDPSSTEVVSVLERNNENLYPDSVADVDSAIVKGGLSPIWIAVILVAAACAVTVVLIFVLTKKKKA